MLPPMGNIARRKVLTNKFLGANSDSPVATSLIYFSGQCTSTRIEMFGRFQLLCQFQPSSSLNWSDFSVSTYSLTLGSGPSPEGLVRTMEGASDHITYLRFDSVLRLQSTCIQSHLGLPHCFVLFPPDSFSIVD